MNKLEHLEKALNDIAQGMVPPGKMPSLDQDKYKFRAEMWSWSQERAREALNFCCGNCACPACGGSGKIE